MISPVWYHLGATQNLPFLTINFRRFNLTLSSNPIFLVGVLDLSQIWGSEYQIVRTLKNNQGCLAEFLAEQIEAKKNPMLSRGAAVAQLSEFVKQGQQAFTNWPKPEAVLKGPENEFCHARKLPPQKFQSKLFGQGIYNP